MYCSYSKPFDSTFISNFVYLDMFFKKKKKEVVQINSKFKLKDFVDFRHRDDIYFGDISNIYLDANGEVFYDIDIAGQCPVTMKGISENRVIRIHK